MERFSPAPPNGYGQNPPSPDLAGVGGQYSPALPSTYSRLRRDILTAQIGAAAAAMSISATAAFTLISAPVFATAFWAGCALLAAEVTRSAGARISARHTDALMRADAARRELFRTQSELAKARISNALRAIPSNVFPLPVRRQKEMH